MAAVLDYISGVVSVIIDIENPIIYNGSNFIKPCCLVMTAAVEKIATREKAPTKKKNGDKPSGLLVWYFVPGVTIWDEKTRFPGASMAGECSEAYHCDTKRISFIKRITDAKNKQI